MPFSRYTTSAIVLTAALSMPALAQDTRPNTAPGSTGATTTTMDSTAQRDDNRGFDWGWLGLLGLVGLMGLRKQPVALPTDTARTTMPR